MISGLIGTVVVLALLWPYIGARGQAGAVFESISAADLQQIIMNDTTAFVLDVRTPAEFTGPLGHVAGSILIPVQELAGRIGELEGNKARDIYVICRSGNRSRTARNILINNGFTATNVLGGMRAWNKLAATD